MEGRGGYGRWEMGGTSVRYCKKAAVPDLVVVLWHLQ